MPDPSPFAAAAGVLVVLLFLLWFALGTQRNIRIGNDVLRWLQDGMPILGRRTTMRWLGSSAIELRITEAAEPFRDATVVIVMEPRDVIFLWAWAKVRGRSDSIIVRANLRRPPTIGIEAWDPAGWTGPPAVEPEWPTVPWPSAGIQARGRAGSDPAPVQAAWAALMACTPEIWRLTVQPVTPHLEVHVRAPDRGVSSSRLLAPLRELARAVGSRA